MNTATVALLGDATRAQALREGLAYLHVHWSDHPAPDRLNLLLSADDDGWRRRLLADSLPFQVARDDTQALRAIGAWLGVELVTTQTDVRSGRGRWVCEACSDPECEHRLFRDLLARRG